MLKMKWTLALLACLGMTSAGGASPITLNIVGPGPYGGAGLTFFDGGPGDLQPGPGLLIVPGAAGVPLIPGITTASFTATSNSPGGPAFALMDLTYLVNATGSTGAVLTITAGDKDYSFPPFGANPLTLTSSYGGTNTNATTVGQQWANIANALLGLGPIVLTQGPFGTGAFSDEDSRNFNRLANDFSLTERVLLAVTANGIASGNLESKVTGTIIPEPSTVVLFGIALPLVGLYVIRRRRAMKAAA